MRLEIQSASDFLVQLIRLNNPRIPVHELELFRSHLVDLLVLRYQDHWFPAIPNKGSGYRCIRINGKIDPIIGQAGDACGFSHPFLRSMFPSELTMWIDPMEVSYRIGENGSICVLFEEKDGTTVISETFSGSPGSRHSTARDYQQQPNSCKDSFRNLYYMDPRTAVHSMEPCAPYVS